MRALRAGRSLAISTAAQGSGIEMAITRIASHGVWYSTVAKIRNGTRRLIMIM